MNETDQLLYFNGLNNAGGYDLPPMPVEKLAGVISGVEQNDRPVEPDNLDELRWHHENKNTPHAGVAEGIDPTNLEQTGWGILFAPGLDPAVKTALEPLINHRRRLAGGNVKIYSGYWEIEKIHDPGSTGPVNSKIKFLSDNRTDSFGPVDPRKVPYYLLLVGSPEQITFEFQYQLDVQYAVGRLDLETAEQYERYVRQLIAAETGVARARPRPAATFFGVANPNDHSTNLSARLLIDPLARNLKEEIGRWDSERPPWAVEVIDRDRATKDRLSALMGGARRPALLFTASHGLAFAKDDPLQAAQQGALVCQDWPGPKDWHQRVPENFYFSGHDLDSGRSLAGSIAFLYACYGAGTPYLDDYARRRNKKPDPITTRPFVARLPGRMLANGALAVIGHVERAWSCSYNWPQDTNRAQIAAFQSAIRRLAKGQPVGYAMEYFDEKYAEISTALSGQIQRLYQGARLEPSGMLNLVSLWTANNDARSYVILGDPAVAIVTEPQPDEPDKKGQETVNLITPPPLIDKEKPSSENRQQPIYRPHIPSPQHPFRKQGEATMEVTTDKDITLKIKVVDDSKKGKMKDGGKKARPKTVQQQLVQALSDLLAETAGSDLEVTTSLNSGPAGQARQAFTRISPDGDTEAWVPQNARGEVDERLWAIHQQNVQQARAQRREALQNLAAAAQLLQALQGKITLSGGSDNVTIGQKQTGDGLNDAPLNSQPSGEGITGDGLKDAPLNSQPSGEGMTGDGLSDAPLNSQPSGEGMTGDGLVDAPLNSQPSGEGGTEED